MNCVCIRLNWRFRTGTVPGADGTDAARAPISTPITRRRWAIAPSAQEGQILDANFTAAKLLCYTRNALIKQSITRFILKEDQDTYYLPASSFLKREDPQNCELQMEKKDSAPFWAPAGNRRSAGQRRHASARRVVMSDITDHKRVEAEKAKHEAQNRQTPEGRKPGPHGRSHCPPFQQPAPGRDGGPGNGHERPAAGCRSGENLLGACRRPARRRKSAA